jgi:hypothetical protein
MIHEGTSMTITAKDGSEINTPAVVENVTYFETGPRAGRIWNVTVRTDDGRTVRLIRNRSQLGGGWINKTHIAKISSRSW